MGDSEQQGGINISIGGSNSAPIAIGNHINQTRGGGSVPAATPGGDSAPTDLRAVLVTLFTEDDLRDLCFDLDVDYESLPGNSKAGKARELVIYCRNRGQLAELEAQIRRRRPQAFG